MVFKVYSPGGNTIESFATKDLLPDDAVLVFDDSRYTEDGKKLYFINGESEAVVQTKYGLFENGHRFEKIFTHVPEILARFPGKAIFRPCINGSCVNKFPHRYEHEKRFFVTEDTSKKEFKISSFCGPKLFPNCYGHHLRRHCYNRQL
jgi:hypothetical protein